MKELICPICHLQYDNIDKKPRLIPICGHTFCSNCIYWFMNDPKNEIICPEDNKKFIYYDPD